MPIFRYTFKKILISPSTWVIFVLTLVILGLSWSLLAVTFLPIILISGTGNTGWTKDLAILLFVPTWRVLVFTSFITLMILIFIGVKATQIFRDEIDDGTLLILVSKPISRNRIWAEKWLSFQVTVISFIFFSILFGSSLLAVPGIGGSVLYLTLLPYMGILFGIALLFELIFTSVVLLLTLVLNSKATIAITIGFAALINIFSQAIDPLVSIPNDYFQLSHAVAVYHDLEKKVSNDDFIWFKEQIALNNQDYKTSIQEIIKEVYTKEDINPDYPNEYDPVQEQVAVHAIITGQQTKGDYTAEQVVLLTHINNIASVFRQWTEQSYEELMTGNRVGNSGSIIWNSKNYVEYNALNVIAGLNVTVDKAIIDNYKTKVAHKKVMRYFNIFYQLYYLWNGAWGDNDSLYISDEQYDSQGDPYLISFTDVTTDATDNKYQVDPSSGKSKIINFPALVSFYTLLGIVLLGTSWYVFNRRDFA